MGADQYGRQDFVEAVRLYRMAANQGSFAAQYNLGTMYSKGEGVAKNAAEAVRWYRMAADQGYAVAQYNLGMKYSRGEGVLENDAEAVRWLRMAADQGYLNAQYSLGQMYDRGEGVPENTAEAVRWYRMAANQGSFAAQYNLGTMYSKGEGVAKNAAEAVRWFRMAADQGYAVAQYNLGIKYDQGQGVPEDDAEAVRWYRTAADQGYPAAQNNLGNMYDQGQGVPEDDAEAVRWYRTAADQGYPAAQNNLGKMYAVGEGVPEDYVQAYKWLNVAAGAGDADAAQTKEKLSRKMTTTQIAEAQRLSGAWRPRAETTLRPDNSGSSPQPPAATADATGSGFLVSSSGHLVTNAHVIDGCTLLKLASGAALRVVAVDTSSDLALLMTSKPQKGAPTFLRQGRGVRLGEDVLVAGFPLSGLLSTGLNVTTGVVSALAGPNDDRRMLQITAPVQPGNSGGPVMDGAGNVVGVVVSKLDAMKVASITGDIPQNVNFAISLGALQPFLDANNVDYLTRASDAPKLRADIAESARAGTVQIQCFQ